MIAHKKVIDKIKNDENVLSLASDELVLAQWSLVVNQSQQCHSEVLYTFMPSKSHVYLLNVGLSDIVLKTYNTEFDDITYHNIHGSKCWVVRNRR